MDYPKEKRKFERFQIGTDIFFTVIYDVKTKIRFQIIDQKSEKILPPKYPAVTRNVSAEGIGFTSLKKLDVGGLLLLEVYALDSRGPVYLQGEVKWCRKVLSTTEDKFDTGVSIKTIGGRDVAETFYHDDQKRVVWSAVLESILGDFREKK